LFGKKKVVIVDHQPLSSIDHHLFGKRKVVIVDHQPLSSIDHHLFGKRKVVIVDHQPLSSMKSPRYLQKVIRYPLPKKLIAKI
jgi:predicted Ser/Thr protein kinase